MLEIVNNGIISKFVDVKTYEKDLKILSDKYTLEVLIHALDKLNNSDNNTPDNPYFKKVNSVRYELLQVKKTLDK